MTNQPTKPTLLIVSFSPIASDARVLKQVTLFRDRYDVTTCGFGPAPEGVVTHLGLPDDIVAWRKDPRWLLTRQYSRVYWGNAAVTRAREMLAGTAFDVVLANDIDTVPLALSLEPRCGVHADLHEYAPGQNTELLSWRLVVAPYMRWLCRRFVSRVSSVTTVARGIADEYGRVFGVRAGVVTNAAPFADLVPGPVASEGGGPLRLVHSGVAQRKRRLDLLIDAVAATDADVTLDLFLMPNDPVHLGELRERAAVGAGDRVHFCEPVPYADLIATLNRYDVGLAVFPFVNFNIRWSLPNKLFDYVQARLAIVVGPSPEMAGRVTDWGVGVVTGDFATEALAEVLNSLTPEQVRGFKAAAHERARELSSEVEVVGWERAIDALIEKSAP